MVATWKIDEKYRKTIAQLFPDHTITMVHNESELASMPHSENIHALLVSSSCFEFERNRVAVAIGVNTHENQYIFFENYARSDRMGQLDDSQLLVPAESWIDLLQIPVAKHCNLNCRSCYHFSNLVKSPEYYPIQQYQKDLSDIKSLNCFVHEIRFLGGEPLLNPLLSKYIIYAKELFPLSSLKVVTNGLLIRALDKELCNCLSELKVKISMSVYPPLYSKVSEIEMFLSQNNIEFEMFRLGEEFDKTLLQHNNNTNVSEIARNCWKCVIIYNGEISRCATGMFIQDLNDYFNVNYPSNNSKPISMFDTSAQLIHYLDQPVPLCEWCAGDERLESHPWSRSLAASLKDYIIEN